MSIVPGRTPIAPIFATLEVIPSKPHLFLILSGVAAFATSVAGSFHLDDYSLLFNPDIASFSGVWDLWRPLATRPLTNTTFWINYQLGHASPLGYHLVNLALHVCAVLLLYNVLGELLPGRAAWIAAALFAIHPMQAEAVNYVFERATLLATVACLLAFREWILGKPWRAVAWFAAALLAKEECVAFPVFLLLLHFSEKRPAKERAPIIAMLALSAAAGIRVMMAIAATAGAAAGAQAGITRTAYLMAEGAVILRYFRMLVLPWGFTIDPEIHSAAGWISWAAWALLIFGAGFAALRFRKLRPGFWFLGGLVLLLPSSSFFPATDLAADRRMYLPLIAFSACLGILLERIDKRVLAVGGVVLIALSIQRSFVWRTERSLWTDAVAKAPEKIRPRIQLARALPPVEALPVLEEAERLAPDNPAIAADKGRTYLELGQPAQALTAFGKALALLPNDAQAFNNRGAALLALGQKDAAVADFDRALAADPCQVDARMNLSRLGMAKPAPPGCRFTPDQLRELRTQ
jgi:tetratricopeptide (TPR) repeat protein